jgi:hypothetical protein
MDYSSCTSASAESCDWFLSYKHTCNFYICRALQKENIGCRWLIRAADMWLQKTCELWSTVAGLKQSGTKCRSRLFPPPYCIWRPSFVQASIFLAFNLHKLKWNLALLCFWEKNLYKLLFLHFLKENRFFKKNQEIIWTCSIVYKVLVAEYLILIVPWIYSMLGQCVCHDYTIT